MQKTDFMKEFEVEFIYAFHQLAKSEYVYCTWQHCNMAARIKNQERTCVFQILGENIPLKDQQKVFIRKITRAFCCSENENLDFRGFVIQ